MDQKIWGETKLLFSNTKTTVHILRVKKGGVCSWHYHDWKYNYFHVISGKFVLRVITYSGSYVTLDLGPDKFVTISPGAKNTHEFEALEDSVVIEICWVTKGRIGLNDIHRLRLGYYKKPDGTEEYAPDDGSTIMMSKFAEKLMDGMDKTLEGQNRTKLTPVTVWLLTWWPRTL